MMPYWNWSEMTKVKTQPSTLPSNIRNPTGNVDAEKSMLR